MGQFGQFILFEEIESVFDETDIFLEAEEAFAFFESQQFDSLRNRRLSQARLIDPKTDKAWRATDRWRELQAIVTHEVKVNGTDWKKIWITFSDVSKLGQRMKISDSKSTPVGIFAFPVDFALNKIKSGGTLPFMSRAYMHVFKTKKAHFEAGGSYGGKNADDFKAVKAKHSELQSSSNSDPKYSEFATEVRGWYRKFYEIVSNLQELDGFEFSSEQREYVAEWASDLHYAVKDNINTYDDSTWPKKMQALVAINPWLNDPQIAVHQIMADETTITSVLKKYIESLDQEIYDAKEEEYKNVHKYINIGDDLSSQMTPEWIEFIKQHAQFYQKQYPEMVAAAEANSRISFDAMKQFEATAFDPYGLGGKYLKAKENSVLAKSPTFMKMIQDYVLGLKQIVEKYSQETPPAPEEEDNNNIPYGNKLKQYATANGLDYQQAIKFAVTKSPKTVYSANQFLYRAAQGFAKQITSKKEEEGEKSDWRMSWNKVLRGLGISSVADTQNSGHLHSAEPTQGVFMDPKDIIQIATIVQQGHSDKNDPANRPKYTWSHFEKQHQRVATPKNQRSGDIRLGDEIKGKSGADRFYTGINHRLQKLKNELDNNKEIRWHNAVKIDSILTKIIKLAKIYNGLMRKNYKEPEPSSYFDSFESQMRSSVKKAESLIANSQNVDEKIKNKVEILGQLFLGIKAKTPLYNRRSQEEFPVPPVLKPGDPGYVGPPEEEEEEEESPHGWSSVGGNEEDNS